MQINEYLLSVRELTQNFIEENLGELLDFDIKNFPEEVGIFFIYKKDTKELEYIGSVDKTNSTIKDMLSEYLNPEFTQLVFRNKVMHNILNTFNWVENEIGEEVKNIEQINETIKYIKENYKVRTIRFPDNTDLRQVHLIEKACIVLEEPNLND